MIWLVGNHGMLGGEVESLLKAGGLAYTATDIDVDITRPDGPAAFLKDRGIERLDWIVNCSAYTAVDAAEDEPERAFAVNADGVRNLCTAARGAGAALLHISTDYVFDGAKKGAYTEDDPPNPIGVYGASKLKGEREILGSLERFVILRTAWLYAGKGKNFVTTMLRLFASRDEVRVVEDQWGSPTYARDLAGAILAIVRPGFSRGGIFNYTNEGHTNWFEFAKEIHSRAAERGLAPRGVRITPVGTGQYPARASRPPNSYLSKEKIKTSFGLPIRDWRAALESCFREEISAQ
jgi:dTDP-4-dehydrorhamnose reductase